MGGVSGTSGSISSFGTQQDRKGEPGAQLRLILCELDVNCDKRCKLIDPWLLSGNMCTEVYQWFQVPQPHNSFL